LADPLATSPTLGTIKARHAKEVARQSIVVLFGPGE
jgi:hypothetical protein